MAARSAPTRDIGAPDLNWGTWGSGLLSDWWETTADLIWPQSVITYGRMRHDPQLKAVLSGYALPIYRANWALDPEGCRDEVVKRVSDDLGIQILGDDSKPGPARRRGVIWHRHLREAMNYLKYGHMPFERRYERQGDGYMRLIHLGPRMPWTLAQINVRRDGQVENIVQTTQQDPIAANRLVWYVNELEGSNWAGISMMRAAFGAWLLKHETWRVHATSIRRFGMGVPYVEAPQGATQTQVQQARDLAASMRAGDSAGIGIPQGFKPMLMGLTGSVPDALAFIQYLDETMAQQALAGLLKLGQTETGSRALGETFLDLFLLSLQAVADEMATTATSGHDGMPGIVTDLVDQNWGEDEPAPRIVCTDVGENYQITAEAINKLTQYGALVPDEATDEWIRKTWRLPKRTSPATILPTGTQPGQGEINPPEQGQPQNPPDINNPSQSVLDNPAPVKASRGFLRRNLTPIEIRAGFDAETHQADWLTAVASLKSQYRRVVRDQRAELVDEVTAAVQQGRADRLALKRPDLGDGPDIIATAMQSAAEVAADQAIREAEFQGVTINPDRVKIDAARLKRTATARAGIAASHLAQQASSKALQVSAASLIDIGLQAGQEVDTFLMGLSDRPLEEQLGAAITSAQNTGRGAVLEAAPESQGTATYYATEILDGNTCRPCQDIDQTPFETLDDAEAVYPGGGYRECDGGLRCRGTIIAVWGETAQPPDPLASVARVVDPDPTLTTAERTKVENALDQLPDAVRADLAGKVNRLLIRHGTDTGRVRQAEGMVTSIGRWSPSQMNLSVAAGMTQEQVTKTFLHEAMHAYDTPLRVAAGEVRDVGLYSRTQRFQDLAQYVRANAPPGWVGPHYAIPGPGDEEMFAELGAHYLLGAPFRYRLQGTGRISAAVQMEITGYFDDLFGGL